jgi:hypothetical protein
MARRSQPYNYPFESQRSIGGKYTKIHQDMFDSKAWQALKLRQRGLYLEFKRKFTKYSSGDTNVNDISMPYSEYTKWYGNDKTFRQDLDELINKGFIKVVSSGWTSRQPSKYGLSDYWQKYGEHDFEIPINHKRPTKEKVKL